ncbi:hypothetical protein EDD18DRAFT_1356842 [Armillaria luteobubalina]|uniref:Endonuclease/exonuclease/phosphatase domain-containing protein n=1 Tax=Armillaria luteobubalina TaxID=153913 RepID=A0AA39PZE8_9AGAR|nr:hypothetical protein EDD18DRAFT_1356842 [Armillaria luteobubalina]
MANAMDEDDIIDEDAIQKLIAEPGLNGNVGQGPPAATTSGLISAVSVVGVTASGFGPNCASASFSIYALNANGMHHTLKLVHINNAIGHQNPSAFIISELKSTTLMANRITLKNYNIFEERSQPMAGTWKWGVMLGIRNNIQVVQRLTIVKAMLCSRVLAVDVALSDSNGKAFMHRIFAVYAPWNPGSNSTEFWHSLAEICNSTPHSWSLAGDLNATVLSIERASTGEDN